jgi:hypothetical protein
VRLSLVLILAAIPLVAHADTPALVFTIPGNPPLEAIGVDALAPANPKHTKFTGAAELDLTGSSPLALLAKVALKKGKATYTFKSPGTTFPRFKGKITTVGQPPMVSALALALAVGNGVVVKDIVPAGVGIAPGGGSPFTGLFTGTFDVTSGAKAGLTGDIDIVVGPDGVAGAWVALAGGEFGGGMSGFADLVTGGITLSQLSTQLSGHVAVSVQLLSTGLSVAGDGTLQLNNNKLTTPSSGTVAIASRADIASSDVGVYFGTLGLTAGPDAPASWPIELFVANDGSGGGDTFDPDGNGFHFTGMVDLASHALTLACGGGKGTLAGVTGSLDGSIPTPTTASAALQLSNGDGGTASLSRIAPSTGVTTTTTTSTTLILPSCQTAELTCTCSDGTVVSNGTGNACGTLFGCKLARKGCIVQCANLGTTGGTCFTDPCTDVCTAQACN